MPTILPSESITIVGMKGSGKTSLLNYLIDNKKPNRRERVVILDTKQVGDFDRFPAVTELKNLHLIAQNNPVVVYAPEMYELKNPSYHDAFFAWGYDRWDTVLVVDELTQIVWGNDVPDAYKDVTDRGRARNVTIWQGNQKPVFVPHAALSEADHYFMFRLMVDKDREKMAGILGKKVIQPIRDKYGFWYFYKTMYEPRYIPGIDLS